MDNNNGTLDALVQQRLESDTDFNASLEGMSDEDKTTAISAKKSEIIENEFKSLREKSEKVTKAEELANNYKVRAEKAEQEAKKLKGEGGTSKNPQNDLSQEDVVELATAISSGEMHKDDRAEVLEFARFKKVSVAEALKSSTLKNILSERKEERQTALATQTRGGARGASKPSDILARARKGDLPESDEDINKLAEARILEKRRK